MMKTWFITGTSSGLGRLLAERLLQRGDRVVATLRREGALDELKIQYDDRLHVLTLDVTDLRAVHTNIAAAFEAIGRIDVVVNNAGYGLFGAAEEVTDEQIDRQIATDLTGSIQVIRAALPHLRRQGSRRIVEVSSEGGQIAYPNFSLYHATKWGIEGFVESVAKEVASFGIDFVIVEPGTDQHAVRCRSRSRGADARVRRYPGGRRQKGGCVQQHCNSGRCRQDGRRNDRRGGLGTSTATLDAWRRCLPTRSALH